MSISRRLMIFLACAAYAAWAESAYAAPISFTAPLTGAEEIPPVETPAKGSAAITYDPATRVVTWTITYTGLAAPATMVHFHGPAEKGKNAPVAIWVSTKGSPAESPSKGEATLTPEQAQQFQAGEWYINVHTQAHRGGEIRGQVEPPKS